MSITLYGIPNCDTVKKARMWLEAHGIAYSFHDYKKAGADADRLAGWCDVLGWETVLNRAGTTFKKLPDADRAGLSGDKAIALMLDQPSMIKRPVVEHPGGLLIGFKPDQWEAALHEAERVIFRLALILVAMLATTPLMASDRPLVIAHRGASGERPEHTLASYERAIEQGGDFIEPDLVLTKDGVLVARHENEISTTTDVAGHPEFAARRATKTIDGTSITGWFTEDFTLAELQTLRARERLPQLRPANTAYDGQFPIPTFTEIIALAQAKSKETGRRIGLYPETKHPSYFASIGLPHEKPLLAALTRAGYRQAGDPIFIQSFEVGNLVALHRKTKLRLIQLVDTSGGPADRRDQSYAQMLSPKGLATIALYAAGIGPAKDLVIARKPDGSLGMPTGLVAAAHAKGLKVHPWTFRAENYFLPADLRSGGDPRAQGNLAAEIEAFAAAGVDGLFSDFPGIARKALGGSR